MFIRRFIPLFAPDDPPAGGSNEPTVDQLQQQVREIQVKYDMLNQRVEKGELVDPQAYVKAQIDAGELFPKARFTGLQQTFQAEQEAHKKTKDTLTQLTTSDMDLKAKFSTLENEIGTLKTQLQEKDGAISTLTGDKKRANLIMEKFPQLAPFEAKGLLPTGAEDQLETLFSAFDEQLTGLRVKAQDDFGAGGGTKTPSSKKDLEPKVPSGSQLYLTQANAALSKGNIAGYNENYDNYLKALQSEKAAN